MHNTWHMAPASIHRHKAHPEQSAHNSGQRDNQKRMKPLNRFSLRRHERTLSSSHVTPPTILSLHAICTLLLCLFWSVSIVLIQCPCEGQSGAWCGLGHTEGQTLHNKSSPLCSTCGQLHKQTHRHARIYKWCSTLTAKTHRAAGNPRFPRSALTFSPTWRYTSTSVVMAASRTCKQQDIFLETKISRHDEMWVCTLKIHLPQYTIFSHFLNKQITGAALVSQ